MNKKRLAVLVTLIAIPCIVLLGIFAFKDKLYAFISVVVAVLSCVPFFAAFERKEQGTIKLVMLAAMIGLSVAGRLVFAAIPGFKPVTALVVLCAIYFGGEAAFMTGALTALISNFYFGQGPWTPFQMFAWGMLGFVAGMMAEKLQKSKVMLSIYGAFAGVFFSLVMDVWTTLWWDGSFNAARYLTNIAAALPLTLEYAISNVIFLLLLAKPIGTMLERIKLKYGIE